MAEDWKRPANRTLREITKVIAYDLIQGESKQEAVSALVTGDGWPEEEAQAFVDRIFVDGRVEEARIKLAERSQGFRLNLAGWYVLLAGGALIIGWAFIGLASLTGIDEVTPIGIGVVFWGGLGVVVFRGLRRRRRPR